jgi:hypothetical protein
VTPVRRRSWVRSGVLLVTVIVAGLASRRYARLLPVLIRKRTGDALWASAAFAGIGLLRPAWSTARVAGVALTVSFAVEFSQRYHAPWIEHIRSYTLGHLLIGSGFYWLDLVAYVVGVAVVVPIDAGWVRRYHPRRPAAGDDKSPVSACFQSFRN